LFQLKVNCIETLRYQTPVVFRIYDIILFLQQDSVVGSVILGERRGEDRR